MLKIGLTGGIGSGKSLVSRVFSILGIPVYNADSEAKRLMQEDRKLLLKLRKNFGPEVIGEKGPDRKALASIIFNDPEALKFVNSVVHPAVTADFHAWLERHTNKPYIVKEAAIMMETSLYRQLDAIILITAPEDLRVKRVMLRDGDEEIKIRSRMANQWADEKKIPLADFVLCNDGSRPLLAPILELHSRFTGGELSAGLKKQHNLI